MKIGIIIDNNTPYENLPHYDMLIILHKKYQTLVDLAPADTIPVSRFLNHVPQYQYGMSRLDGSIQMNINFINKLHTWNKNLLFDLDLFLKKFIYNNCERQLLDINELFTMLCFLFEEFKNALITFDPTLTKVGLTQLDDKFIFSYSKFYQPGTVQRSLEKPPVLSVLMPVYNNENYILDSVWSVLNQTFTQFELIIISELDSTDHTTPLIKLFSDPRIRVIQNSIKLGLAASLNEGIRASRGKYIARIDADDICVTQRFQKQLTYLESHHKVDLLGSNVEIFNKSKVHLSNFPLSNDDIQAHLIFHLVIAHSAIMFRKARFIKLNLIYDEKAYGEDYELWVRSKSMLQFENLPDVLVKYREHDSNITKNKRKQLAKETSTIICQTLKDDFNLNIPHKYMKFFNSWHNYYSTYGSASCGKRWNRPLEFEKRLLLKMWFINLSKKKYRLTSLTRAIIFRWSWTAQGRKQNGGHNEGSYFSRGKRYAAEFCHKGSHTKVDGSVKRKTHLRVSNRNAKEKFNL